MSKIVNTPPVQYPPLLPSGRLRAGINSGGVLDKPGVTPAPAAGTAGSQQIGDGHSQGFFPSSIGYGRTTDDLRFIDRNSIFGGMSSVGNPNISKDDNTLVKDFRLNLGSFKKFGEGDKLTMLSLQKIAKEQPRELTEESVKLVKAMLTRPVQLDAIRDSGGEIAEKSLAKAELELKGNTDTNLLNINPYHTQSNEQLANAFKGIFDRIRDESEDMNFFSEKHRYVSTKAMLKIADEFSDDGSPKPGIERTQSDDVVWMMKTIRDRPGLMHSWDDYKANGYNPLGSRNHDGWIKNYSIDRWIENEQAEKRK